MLPEELCQARVCFPHFVGRRIRCAKQSSALIEAEYSFATATWRACRRAGTVAPCGAVSVQRRAFSALRIAISANITIQPCKYQTVDATEGQSLRRRCARAASDRRSASCRSRWWRRAAPSAAARSRSDRANDSSVPGLRCARAYRSATDAKLFGLHAEEAGGKPDRDDDEQDDADAGAGEIASGNQLLQPILATAQKILKIGSLRARAPGATALILPRHRYSPRAKVWRNVVARPALPVGLIREASCPYNATFRCP